ncbi:MAG TPA: DMT family transporter [Myxococcota bacterium]|nr:DMT family transporter [Myxococcota bacterium]
MHLDFSAATLVLFAAFLHATWNALAKASGDRVVTLAGVMTTSLVFGLLVSPFVAAPARAAWPYLAASSVFHFGYQIFLLYAYRFGDLSLVYPIARGTAPLLVAILGASFAGEVPRPLQACGIGLASVAMTSFAFEPRVPHKGVARSIAAAFVTATMIGCYTYLDGQGVRHAGGQLSYIAWNSWATSFAFCIFALVRNRGRLAPFLGREGARGVAGGVLALLAYGIVLWAMSRGAMANVASLRETSVVIAALIGTRILGEGFASRRIAAALCVALGVALLQLG